MSRYIDADALIEELQHCSYETWSKDINRAWWAQAVKIKDNIVKCIERQPTAAVVEVVRCKDCKFNVANMQIDENDGTDYSGEDIVCSYFMTDGMEENDYCSHGKRREE